MTVVSPFLRIIISYFLLIIKINSRHSLRKYQELNDINKEQIHLKIERLKILKEIYNQEDELHSLNEQQQQQQQEVKKEIEKDLFPWSRIDLKSIRKRYTIERGIVMSTGNKYFSMTIHCIRILQDIHHCRLPIEIFYMGNSDLDFWKVQWIESNFSNIKMIDLTQFLMNEHPNLLLKGWDLKPFSITYSSFKEALFVDSDVIFMKDPLSFMWGVEENRINFLMTGALFFHDRLIGPPLKEYKEFYRKLFYGNLEIFKEEKVSKNIKKSRIFNGLSKHDMDSGLLLIDKERHFWGLLGSIILNSLPEREEIHRNTWGDKETFWLGFELMKEPYTWLDERAGNIGEVINSSDSGGHTTTSLCGHMAHFDSKGKLLWFQDGIVKDKKKDPRFMLFHPLHTSRDGGWVTGYCSNGNLDPLSKEELYLLEEIRGIWEWNPLVVN